MDKLPPIEKIPEAYSAIAGGRVELQSNCAKVKSSDGQKTYDVIWDNNVYSSNDNATYWQGYAGYPVLAVLMLLGKLPLDMRIAEHFKGINWTSLNKKHKRNYENALNEVMDSLKNDGVDISHIVAEIKKVFDSLPKLDIELKRKLK